MKYLKLTSNRDSDLLSQLNSPAYANYRVIAILKSGIEDVAYLERDEIKPVIEVQSKGKTKSKE